MSIVTILIIILVVLLVVSLPNWQHSAEWGYLPGGAIGLILIVLLVLLLLGKI